MKYFKSDKDWQYDSRLLKDDNKWLFYTEGYRQASELVEKQILEIDRTAQDFLIYPYCYLIRHYIEIRLKEIIDEGNKLNGTHIVSIEGAHDLSILWRRSQETLKNVWNDEYKEPLNDVSDFIGEFHTIDVKSDSFRYPVDKNGMETLGKINQINFKILAEAFEKVKHYLDGVTDKLAVGKEGNGL